MTLRWRIERWRVWNPATSLDSWLGLLLDRILRLACVSISVTSMSATAPVAPPPFPPVMPLLLDDDEDEEMALYLVCLLSGSWDQVYCGQTKNCENGGIMNLVSSAAAGAAPGVWLLDSSAISFCCSFWASKDWRRCSNSLTNSIAPPTIDAWSPCNDQKSWNLYP